MKSFDLDGAISRSDLGDGLAASSIRQPISELLARSVFWILFLFFLALSVQHLGVDLSVVPLESFIAFLPRAVGAVLFLIFGALAAQVIGGAAGAGAAALGVAMHRSLGRLVRVLLMVMVAILTIDQLGFEVSLLTGTLQNLISLFVAGFVLTFALGGRDIARSAIASYYVRDFLSAGDHLECDGISGEIESIGVTNTRVRTEQGIVHVPNSLLVSRIVKSSQAEQSVPGAQQPVAEEPGE
jgi:small-conductance mechanosensitive channel